MKWTPMILDSFDAMDRMMNDVHDLVPRGTNSLVPPIDMYETKDAVIVETPMPGVDPSKIEISIDNGTLSIKGTMERKTEVDDKNFYRKEVRYGTVFRQVALPTSVSEANAEANYEEGVLKISLPKAEQKKAITINVKKK